MKPRSAIKGDFIEYKFWLSFDSKGSVRMTRGEPELRRAERAMSMTTRLPRSLFITPTLRATVDVGDVESAIDIMVDVEAAKAAMKAALGIDIDLVVNTPDDAEIDA